MKYLQEAIHPTQSEEKSNTLIFFHFINLFLVLINFALNFMGNPILKYFYLLHVVFIIIVAFSYRLEQIFPEIISLFFLEGQGRILWEYQGWSRIIFDSTLLIAAIRVFIINRKFYDRKIIPLPIIILIALHLLWYSVQFFNIYAASLFGVIGAIKIYIFPILLFLGLSLSKLDSNNKNFTNLLLFFALIMILELFLNYYQLTEKQDFLYKMSSYYYTATRNGVFTGLLFRPFATTQLPGALSVFIFLTAGLLYIRNLSWKQSILRLAIIGFAIFNLIICQVRSALIKYLLIIGIIYLGNIIFHRLKLKKIFPLLFVLLMSVLVSQNIDSRLSRLLSSADNESLSYSVDRVTSLADTGKMSGQRIDSQVFFTKIFNQISEYPLGVGPGMTGPAASINQDFLNKDPLLNKNTLWTYDNLFISLFIDLGIGAIFYIALIFTIPAYFSRMLIKYYKNKDEEKFRLLLICTSSLVVILLGNWGALGLTYNPESFIFWFFSALGFYTISDTREFNERNIPVLSTIK